MLQPKLNSMTTVNMEIMQEKDKPNLNEFDDLLSKVSRRKIPNGREIEKIVTIAVSILTDSWETPGEHPSCFGKRPVPRAVPFPLIWIAGGVSLPI